MLCTEKIYPLTCNNDIDYNILYYMKFNQLITTYQISKYTYKLCENKQFWINKVKHDNLLLPDKSLLNDITGIKIYHICNTVKHHMNNRDSMWGVNINTIVHLIITHVPPNEKEFLPDLSNIHFNSINVYFLGNDEFVILLVYKYPNNLLDIVSNIVMDRNTVFNFLFDGLKNNILTI